MSLCSVCMKKSIDTVIIPCYHACMCRSCADRVLNRANTGKCPICRRQIQRLRTIYLSGVSAGDSKEPESEDIEHIEQGVDMVFIIRNNLDHLNPFARMSARGDGDDIAVLLRDVPQFNFVRNGLTGTLSTTLSKATRVDLGRIEEKLRAKGLKLEIIDNTEDKKVYEIKRV